MFKLRNMEEFSNEIENLVKTRNLTYLEAIIFHLQKSGMEVDNNKIKNLLSPRIHQKLFEEAIENNMLGRGFKNKKLPF